MAAEPLYNIQNLWKQRQREKGYRLHVRRLMIEKGDAIALTGPSGCGKSTSLDILGLSLRPDVADSFLFEPQKQTAPVDIMALWQKGAQDEIAALRLNNIGYVLQSGELLPFLSTGENMELTAKLSGMSPAEAKDSAWDLAKMLNVEELWNAMPSTLSVGERQRAAICRALAARPGIILADEPTAALDPLHAADVMAVFLETAKKSGATIILVTHNAQWAKSGGLTEVPFHMVKDEAGTTAVVEYPAGGAANG